MTDKALKREPGPASTVPYGDYDTMFSTLVSQLEKGPYMLGERFSAADILWGSALAWMTLFKLVPELPVIARYVERYNARPCVVITKEKDEALAAAQAA